MSFDIDSVLRDMVDAANDVVKEEKEEIKESVKEILHTEKKSLQNLSEAMLRKEIDNVIFEKEIKREKIVIEAELLTIKIMTDALAQKVVNAVTDVFFKAVNAAM